MIPGGTTVNPHSSTDATSGVGGIGPQYFTFGGNPNAGILPGGSAPSWVWILGGAVLGAGALYLLARRR